MLSLDDIFCRLRRHQESTTFFCALTSMSTYFSMALVVGYLCSTKEIHKDYVYLRQRKKAASNCCGSAIAWRLQVKKRSCFLHGKDVCIARVRNNWTMLSSSCRLLRFSHSSVLYSFVTLLFTLSTYRVYRTKHKWHPKIYRTGIWGILTYVCTSSMSMNKQITH